MPIGVQMVVCDVQMLLDQLGDTLETGSLGDFDVTSHGGVLVKNGQCGEFTSLPLI